MFHTIILAGNLGRDPEMRYTQSGVPVTNFRMAVNRRWTGQDGQRQEKALLLAILRHQHDALLSHPHRFRQHLEVDLRFAAAGDAVQQEGAELARVQQVRGRRHGLVLGDSHRNLDPVSHLAVHLDRDLDRVVGQRPSGWPETVAVEACDQRAAVRCDDGAVRKLHLVGDDARRAVGRWRERR